MTDLVSPWLAEQIEKRLLECRDWIPAQQLVAEFGLKSERYLRASGDKPGLCSAFAISSNKGFRHVRCCTQEEFAAFYETMRKHGIGELVRAGRLRRMRTNVVSDNASVVDGQMIAAAVAPFVPVAEEVAA